MPALEPADDPPSAPPSDAPLAIVGREPELARLLSEYEASTRGGGRIVFLSGDSGIGKTRVAREFAARVGLRGGLVCWGDARTGDGGESRPWSQIVRALADGSLCPSWMSVSDARYLARLVPEMAPTPAEAGGPSMESEHGQFYLFDAVSRLIAGAADRQPTAIVLEDAHDADRSALLLLRFIASEIRESRALVLVTHREDGARGPGQTIDPLAGTARDTLRVRLAGLDANAVAELLAHVIGSPPAARTVREVTTLTGGNPSFVEEVGRRLRSGGSSVAVGGAELVHGGAGRLEELVERRLAPLSADARRLLAMAAIIGDEFPAGLLGAVSGLPRADLADAIAEWTSAEIVAEASSPPGRFRFVSATVREVLAASLDERTCRELHLRIAAALERAHATNLDAVLSRLAAHYAAAAPLGDPAKAVEFALRSGRRALERLAYDEAARELERALAALDHWPEPDQALRCDALIHLGEAQRCMGRRDLAATSFGSAAEIARAIGSARRLAVAALRFAGEPAPLAEPSAAQGRTDPVLVAMLEAALDVLGDEDPRLRAELLGRLAAALYWQPETLERRRTLCDEALAIARASGEPIAVAVALHHGRHALWGPDDLERRLADANEATRLAERAGDRERGLQARQWKISDLLEIGDGYGADVEIDAFGRLAAALRLPLHLSYAAMFRATRAALRGRFAEVEPLAAEALRLGELAGNPAAQTFYGAHVLRVAWQRGELQALEEPLRAVISQIDVPVAQAALGLVFWECGKPDEARTAFEALAARGFETFPRDLAWLPVTALCAELCARVGDVVHAELLHRLLAPYAGRMVVAGPPAADCLGPVDHFTGLLAAALGRRESAVAHFEAALRVSLAMGALPLATRTWLEFGELPVVTGEERGRACAVLRQALEAAESLGMLGVARRARARLGAVEGAAEVASRATASLRKTGDSWTLAFGGHRFELGDALGLYYLAQLLQRPGDEIHVTELVASAIGPGLTRLRKKASSVGAELSTTDLGHAGEVLDRRARLEYEQRLGELASELERARACDDPEGAAAIEEEAAFLKRELGAGFGLGGRVRKAADVNERVRKAVTNRLRDTVNRIRARHAELAAHLDRSLRMGAFCSYAPDVAVAWTF